MLEIVETNVVEFSGFRSASAYETCRKIKAIGRLEKARIDAINRELIDTMIATVDGRNQRTITMYRNPEDGKHYVAVNGRAVHAGDTRAECAMRAVKAGLYTMRDYNRIIHKKKG